MNLLEWAILFGHAVLAPTTAAHALLYKRDSRAALGWIAICLLFPWLGPVLYYFFGVNRVRSRARKLSAGRRFRFHVGFERGAIRLPDPNPPDHPMIEFDEIGGRVTGVGVVAGNRVEMLHDGEETYPAMLAAIRAARTRIALSSYIFDSDATGRQFLDALSEARARGADVRVVVDGIGEHYSWPRISRLLRRRQIAVQRFIPPRILPPTFNVNLRTHRKILVADGEMAFTGGMNIGDRHLVADAGNRRCVHDVHFRIEGPIALELEKVFLADWVFAGGAPSAAPVAAASGHAGDAFCRVVADGPDDDLDRLALILNGVISAARSQVLIMTPYFLPSRDLIAVLQAAALRGVDVCIVLPARSNLPFVHWATQNLLWELLGYGVSICYQPPPFNHSKLLVVDDRYAMIGSANLDPRSLRLNFELGVEVFDPAFAWRVADHIRTVRKGARPVTLAEVDGRSLPARFRDAFCWLFSPYL